MLTEPPGTSRGGKDLNVRENRLDGRGVVDHAGKLFVVAEGAAIGILISDTP